MIIDYMTDLSGDPETAEEKVLVNIKSSKSNSGRDFITLEIV